MTRGAADETPVESCPARISAQSSPQNFGSKLAAEFRLKASSSNELAAGIPLKTRHREVAPNQYEFAPLFGRVIEQVVTL